MFDTLRRWFAAPKKARPITRARLTLERLEDRNCPSVTYIGPNGGDWNTGANWSGGVAPGPFSDVVLDGNYSRGDVIFTGGYYSQMCNSLTLKANYGGTLHLQQGGPAAIGPGGIDLESGDIEQETGQDIIDGGNMTWGGGDLNANSPFLADLKVAAGGRVSITGADAKINGTNLDLMNGALATFNLAAPGVLSFLKNARLTIDATSTFNWVDGDIQGAGTSAIVNAGKLYKTPGVNPTTSSMPIKNTGTFQLQAGTLGIAGRDANGYSFDQSGGTTDLWNGSILFLGGDYHMSAGNFWTEGALASIRGLGNVTFDGGTINLNHGQQGGATGSLTVANNLKIQGTTEWDAKVDGTALTADKITSSNMTIGNQTTFKAIGVNLPGGRVPLNQRWQFISCSNQINTDFGTIILAFNDGTGGSWVISTNVAGTAWYLGS